MTRTGLRAMTAAQLVRPPRFARVSARILAFTLLFGSIAAAFVPWQQTSRGSGRVIAYSPIEREQVLKAPISGQIAYWRVQEGAHVKKGALIVEISDNDPRILERLKQERDATASQSKAAKGSISALTSRLEALKRARTLSIAAAEAKVRMARNKVKAARQKLKGADATLKTAQLNLSRQRQLEKRGLSSRRVLEVAELSQAKAKAAVYSARASLEGARANVLALQAERQRVGADLLAKIAKAQSTLEKSRGEQGKASASLAKVEVRLSRQAQMRIVAPRDGTIVRVIAKQGGEYVKAGDALAVLVPDTARRAVTLWVDGNDAPLIYPGREVRLQFEGWPAVQFSGWPSVAVGTFGGKVDFVDATANREGRFRVVVVANGEPWPEVRYLRQGVRANGWVLLNRVTIGYEVWRQLNGFPPAAKRKPKLDDEATEKSAGSKKAAAR